jgi:hypothetical protein
MSGSKRKVGASSSASSDNHNKRVQDAGSSTIEGNLNLKQYLY